ncbi:ATP dependent DNA ligase [Thalassoroseus pseudoceratinae]|uniref:ATP dependent DNA ligase n=1 Tax=Thalassoroseus pseudoceratinae TaxID=2713176 RepID=UPI00141EAD96|nr:hypothetical protein [Thalassoroseus pseudoceratinae]
MSAPTSEQTKLTTCPQCQETTEWGAASWCPECGYYPAFATVPKSAAPVLKDFDDEDDEDVEERPWEEPEPGPIWQLVPGWLILLVIGMIAMLGVSIAGRALTASDEGSMRLLWTLTQLFAGVAVAGLAHTASYMHAIQKNDKLSPMDFLLKPGEVWKPTLANLPATGNRLCLWAWGVTAIFGALIIVGGIRWSAMFEDWGFEKSAQKNLVQAVVQKARQEQAEKAAQNGSLEEAMNDFVGEEEENKEPKPPAIETDCVVVGYRANQKGDVMMLLLAAAPRGRLQYLGTLNVTDLPQETSETLNERIRRTEHRATPFVSPMPISGNWLQPTLLVRVGHDDWTKNFRMIRPVFLELLRETKL